MTKTYRKQLRKHATHGIGLWVIDIENAKEGWNIVGITAADIEAYWLENVYPYAIHHRKPDNPDSSEYEEETLECSKTATYWNAKHGMSIMKKYVKRHLSQLEWRQLTAAFTEWVEEQIKIDFGSRENMIEWKKAI